jgi:uncharacterized protein DUF6458
MDTATGIFLIALGAVLKFAVNASIKGVELDTIGVILMVAGAAVLVFGLFFEARWADRRRRGDRVVVEERVDRGV